jgi:hypothetical protein
MTPQSIRESHDRPDTAVTRRICFKDFLAPGCREPFSLLQGRLDDLTTSRLGDGAHPNPKSPAKGSAKHPRDFCGTLPCRSVLSCARRSQRPSSPQVSINFVANRIRQLQIQLLTEIRNCSVGPPLQGECRRFDPVSTHQLSCYSAWSFWSVGSSARCRARATVVPTPQSRVAAPTSDSERPRARRRGRHLCSGY